MNHFEVLDYVCDGKIGTGSFAEVWKGYHKVTKQPVAIKVVDLERLSRSNNNSENKLKQHLNSEMKIMKAMDHKNIVKMFDFEETKSHIIMIIELCEGGDFSKYIKKYKRLSESRAKYFMQQLASGLEFLRKEGVIHRDLKPQNLLLSDSSERSLLKIADFGFARYIDTQSMAHTLCGSPLYMAPEILKLHNYTVKADLWSVGIILYEILVGVPPFEAKNIITLMQAVEENSVKFPPSIQISSSCMDLIKGLLQKDPNQRISWEEFFLHPWLGMHQPPPHTTPSSQATPPSHLHQMTHSKSQPSIAVAPSPYHNFLHDERVLQQNLFNQFSNTSNPNTPTSATAPHHLPRSQSTSVLPSYKVTGSGNVIPVNPLISAISRNTPPDPNKRGRTLPAQTSSGQSPFTGPSSLPSTANYARRGSGSSSASSSPPRGSPFSTPPISPNPTTSSGSRPPFSVPPLPLSSSPTYSTYQKPSFIPSDTSSPRVPSDSQSRMPTPYSKSKLPTSFSQKQFLVVPKVTTNSDSFEKDCVILSHSTSNPNSAELTIEDQIIDALETKYKRALAVADLGDLKIEGEMPYEAFAVYIKGVELFWQTLEFARTRAQEHNLTQSPKVIEVVNIVKEKACLYMKTVEYWKSVLRATEVIPDPAYIIYYHALHMGRLAAVDESFNKFSTSEEVYYTAILLLESLLEDSEHDNTRNDKEILRKYIVAFSKRLAAVQGKKPTNFSGNV